MESARPAPPGYLRPHRLAWRSVVRETVSSTSGSPSSASRTSSTAGPSTASARTTAARPARTRPLFLREAHDDASGVMKNMGLPTRNPRQLLFTFSSAIAVVNSVVGASALAFLATASGAPLTIASLVGVIFAVVSFVLLLRSQPHRQRESGGQQEALFPSPPADRQRLE